jgi:hypothetical protein
MIGVARYHVHCPRRLPFLAEASCVSRRLLPRLRGATPIHCRPKLRCGAHFLDPDLACGLLETLEMYCLRPRSPYQSKNSPFFRVGRSALLDSCFGDPVGNSRFGEWGDRMDSPHGCSGGRNLAPRASATFSEGAIVAGATRGHPASHGRHLPILLHASALRQRHTMVLSEL